MVGLGEPLLGGSDPSLSDAAGVYCECVTAIIDGTNPTASAYQGWILAILSPLPLFALLVTSLWLMCGEKPVPAVKRPALPVFGAPPAAKALF